MHEERRMISRREVKKPKQDKTDLATEKLPLCPLAAGFRVLGEVASDVFRADPQSVSISIGITKKGRRYFNVMERN